MYIIKIHKIFFALFVFIFVMSTMYRIPLAESNSKQIIISKTRELYLELMKFKNESKFHKVGFGRCCKYYIWKQKVEELAKDSNAKLLVLEGVAVMDLIMLGFQYLRTEGRETDDTQYLNKQFKKALNLKN